MNATNQPVWKMIANLGDVNPLDYGGYFVYIDETGVYPPEAERLEESHKGYEVHRFILDRCTYTNGILSDNKFHPEHPAWFADDIDSAASFVGQDAQELIDALCDPDPCMRAEAYRAIGDYHGWENLDSYPLHLTQEEAIEKYGKDV